MRKLSVLSLTLFVVTTATFELPWANDKSVKELEKWEVRELEDEQGEILADERAKVRFLA